MVNIWSREERLKPRERGDISYPLVEEGEKRKENEGLELTLICESRRDGKDGQRAVQLRRKENTHNSPIYPVFSAC